MSDTLSEESKSSLKTILESPLMRKAISLALVDVWNSKAGARTLEEAAMSYNYQAGATEVLERLHALAAIKKMQQPTTNRLRPE